MTRSQESSPSNRAHRVRSALIILLDETDKCDVTQYRRRVRCDGDEPVGHPRRSAHGSPAMERLGQSSSAISCFANVQQKLGSSVWSLTDTPLTPSQIAVNYPARAYGITRHETPADALKKCPDLKLVHVQTYKNGEKEPGYWEGAKPETHKVSWLWNVWQGFRDVRVFIRPHAVVLTCKDRPQVSLDMYRKESRKILAVFSEFCPIVGASETRHYGSEEC